MIFSWLIYIPAYSLPALILNIQDNKRIWLGWECAIQLFCFFLLHFEIFANPLFVCASILLLTKFKTAGQIVALLTLALASQTFALFFNSFPIDEGGTQARLIGFGMGFYLWYGAIAAVAVASVMRCRGHESLK